MDIKNKLKALEDHLKDRKQKLRKGNYEASPYLVSYLLLHKRSAAIMASNGGIVDEMKDNVSSSLIAQVRAGSYDFDGAGYVTTDKVPVDDDYAAMRNLLWEMTWPAHHAAQINYLMKCEECINTDLPRLVKSFSKVEPSRFNSRKECPGIDLKERRDFLKQATSCFNRHSEINLSSIVFGFADILKAYVSSEGSSIVQQESYFTFAVSASAIAPDNGELLSLTDIHFTTKVGELPSKKTVLNGIESMISNLKEMMSAPVQRAGHYPAMFDPDNTGVLFHEIVGHRLEGERQDSEQEGDTFEDKIGHEIAPDFVTLIDDPTIEHIIDSEGNKRSFPGYYHFDDEGVPASRVVLIEGGILKNYLLSRQPVFGYDAGPNGHGRTDCVSPPIARMSNLMVSSSKPLSKERLKEVLMEECLRQGKDYGLVFKDSRGGYTSTQEDYFRIFPQKLYRLWAVDAKDPDTGKRFRKGDLQLVRGVGTTGTPLTILNNLVGMGDDYVVCSGFCGAESGWVKVGQMAPSSVFSQIEVSAVESRSFINLHPKPSTYLENDRKRRRKKRAEP